MTLMLGLHLESWQHTMLARTFRTWRLISGCHRLLCTISEVSKPAQFVSCTETGMQAGKGDANRGGTVARLDRSLGMASSSVRCCCSFSSRRSFASALAVMAARCMLPSGFFTILIGETCRRRVMVKSRFHEPREVVLSTGCEHKAVALGSNHLDTEGVNASLQDKVCAGR